MYNNDAGLYFMMFQISLDPDTQSKPACPHRGAYTSFPRYMNTGAVDANFKAVRVKRKMQNYITLGGKHRQSYSVHMAMYATWSLLNH